MTTSDNPINEEIQQHEIQILDAILYHSFAAPLPEDHDHEETGLDVNIQISIYEQQAQAMLHVDYIIIDNETNSGYGLGFGILGSFQSPADMPVDILAEFAKVNSLSFLWPYAREYSSSLIRRMSINAPPLPVINPQTMTPLLMETGKIRIDILGDSEEE